MNERKEVRVPDVCVCVCVWNVWSRSSIIGGDGGDDDDDGWQQKAH